ncbi:hypothetical protein COL41_27785 [Bacillus mycoides]|uniref:UvrD-helicase domain-containing protein n=1 Tax=Bacillus mycoides TaxID=1405 RepID=UPI000BF604DC|nr:UvrD-helicase domain-containing protein [Bacillus mycoides]MED1383517.1 UvrD-helicase domain-containing protein [Bacillus mycoides]PFX90135.1 hypothetical protein COL41_27785 [Bacillus mycoides]
MKIIVAGAGAGKTTSMAESVLERIKEGTDGKIVYVISYTNAARDCIRQKVIELNGSIPKNLFIETLHVFLLKEFIYPFHHLLYGQQYTKAIQIKLPIQPWFRSPKLQQLHHDKIIHVSEVTQTARWVVFKKTGDNRQIREKREKILGIVSKYLDSIYIDEAQDIDEHLLKVVGTLDGKGINICLVGDPKQDLRGVNVFKKLVAEHHEHVKYISENYRCPKLHIRLANLYISEAEKQIPQTEASGELNYVFEKDIDINRFAKIEDWDHVFISKKNARFITHGKDKNEVQQNLAYELKSVVIKTEVPERLVDKYVYDMQKKILKNLVTLNDIQLFSMLEGLLGSRLEGQDKGRLRESFRIMRENPNVSGLLVKSIDSIKGLEGDRCLFIVTTDLASYLFGEKTGQNKMLNYLYVALTRSREKLVLLITNEVEAKYSRATIDAFFNSIFSIKEERSKETTLV